jgi:tRNA threonylcarbamoyladenosine dehydratase
MIDGKACRYASAAKRTTGNRTMASDLSAPAAQLARRFGGVARLYGETAAACFRASHVVVVGIGGVGSWTAEALARSAVGELTLVDLDHIAESNANRQIHALDPAFGKPKVSAMQERIAAINPVCRVHAVDEFAGDDNAARLIGGADVVVDCVDQVRAKVALIVAARAAGVALISCGAAGGRSDPTRVRCDDLGLVVGDPLLSKVRYRLRRAHGFPAAAIVRARFGVAGVYSDEPVRRPGDADARLSAGLACAGYGSSVALTATMGFVAAAQVLDLLADRSAGKALVPA